MTTVVRETLARFVAVLGIDRAMALGAQAFGALMPFLIVYAAIVPQSDGEDFADELVDRFDLSGASARSLREAFAPRADVEDGLTALGLVLLLVSALAFTRALQRLYEAIHGVPARGMRGTRAGLAWLGGLTVVLTLQPLVLGALDGVAATVAALALALTLWLATPYVLLGGRVAAGVLLPGAVLTALAMSAFGATTVVWLPTSVATSADQFGVIGVGFALLTWFFAAAVVIVASASAGAVAGEHLATRARTTRAG